MKKFLQYKTLISIQIGAYASISAIIVGITMCNYGGGLVSALFSLCIGSIIACLLALIFVNRSLQNRETLIQLTLNYLGTSSTLFVGLAFAISLIGWYAIQLSIILQAILLILPNISSIITTFIINIIIAFNVAYGVSAIGKLANYLMFFIFMGFVYLTYTCFNFIYTDYHNIYHNILDNDTNLTLKSVPLFLASSIAGIIDGPTYFCHAKTKKDAYIAVYVVYLIILPLLTLIGIILSAYYMSNSNDIITILSKLSNIKFINFGMLIFVISSIWITNNSNLYSANIALTPIITTLYIKITTQKNIKKNAKTYKIIQILQIILLCVIGTIISMIYHKIQNFEDLLSAINIAVSALGGVLLTRFYFKKIKITQISSTIYLVVILIGVFIGILSQLQLLSISGYGFLDSFIVSVIMCAIVDTCRHKQFNCYFLENK